jgi:hypothetical protein
MPPTKGQTHEPSRAEYHAALLSINERLTQLPQLPVLAERLAGVCQDLAEFSGSLKNVGERMATKEDIDGLRKTIGEIKDTQEAQGKQLSAHHEVIRWVAPTGVFAGLATAIGLIYGAVELVKGWAH